MFYKQKILLVLIVVLLNVFYMHAQNEIPTHASVSAPKIDQNGDLTKQGNQNIHN